MSRRSDTRRQLSFDPLFFEVAPTPRSEAGALDISNAIREVLSDVLSEVKSRSAGKLDRYEVAAAVSRLSGRDVTKNMLDRYAAPSADDWRFPLESLPAFTKATGDYRLLEMVADRCGCKILRGEEAWIAEVGALMLQEQQVKKRLSRCKTAAPSDVLDRLTKKVLKRLGGKS